MVIIPGTVILTSHKDPSKNSYGRFNHAAIAISDTKIVEALQTENGVVVNFLSQLIKHKNTNEYIFLIPKNTVLGEAAARAAYDLSGSKYRFWSSFFPRISGRDIKSGINCINTVNEAYRIATGINPVWRIPDNVLGSNLFWHSNIFRNA